MDRCAEF